MVVRTLQPALNRLGDDAFNRYAEKAREPSVTADQLHGLASLIGALDYRRLSPRLVLEVALDETLPDDIRLQAFCVASRPLDDRALPIVRRALAGDDFGHWAAMKAVSYSLDPDSVVRSLLDDVSIPKERRRYLAGSLQTLFPDLERRLAFIRRCAADSTLPPDLQDMMLTFAARYGDRAAFEALLDRLSTLGIDVACAAVALLGHYRSRELGIRAAEAIATRVTRTSEAVNFAGSAEIGMNYVFDMDSFRNGVMRRSSPHPSQDVWSELVETWTRWNDATEIEQLRLLLAASQLGSARAVDSLETSVCSLMNPDDARFDAEDEVGHHIRAGIDELRQKRRLLPMTVGERFARALRPNVQYAGVDAIAAHADRAALDLLVRLHNDSRAWQMRGTLSETIETLAGRLGVIVTKAGNDLKCS